MSTSPSLVNSVLSALGSSSSGIDVTSAVSSILYADESGMRQLQTQQATLATHTAAINQLQTETSSLSDSLNNLSNLIGPLSSVSAISSNASVATASAAAGTPSANYSVEVDNLATTAMAYSNEVLSRSTPLGTGSVVITEGGNQTSIPTGSGVDTLDQLVSAINSQSLGVTASVITDSAGARLSLVSSTSGAASSFSVSSSGSLSFNQTAGTDANLKVNGVPIQSASNTVTGGISGLTLNLQSVSPAGTTVTIGVSADTSSITTAVSSFVTAYNALIGDVNSQFAYNAGTQTAGTLAGDSTIEGLQSALLSATNYSYTGTGAVSSLAQLGVSTNSDGTLTLNAATLGSAIANNPTGVTQFFQGTALNGFADTLNAALTTYTDPSQGAFTVELNSISSETKDLGDQISSDTTYFASQSTTLTARYNQIDIELQQLPSKLKQIDALLGFDNNSSSSN